MRIHKENGPNHVAIIMDGNGRWAQAKCLPRSAGHERGAAAFEAIVEASAELGVRELSAYVFSTENWGRDKDEVEFILKVFLKYLKKLRSRAVRQNIKVQVIGDRSDPRISENLRRAMQDIETNTASCDKLTVNLAFNYGGEADLLQAAKLVAAHAQTHPGLRVEDIVRTQFRSHLFSGRVSDVDLLVRTGGELRLSNFLPLQTRYAELYFSETCWPAFTVEMFKKALEEFQNRHRTFGKVETLAAAE